MGDGRSRDGTLTELDIHILRRRIGWPRVRLPSDTITEAIVVAGNVTRRKAEAGIKERRWSRHPQVAIDTIGLLAEIAYTLWRGGEARERLEVWKVWKVGASDPNDHADGTDVKALFEREGGDTLYVTDGNPHPRWRYVVAAVATDYDNVDFVGWMSVAKFCRINKLVNRQTVKDVDPRLVGQIGKIATRRVPYEILAPMEYGLW